MEDGPLIALCVGHSRLVNGRPEGGAADVNGCQEWEIHRGTARLIAGRLSDAGAHCEIFDRYEGAGYAAAMAWLGGHLAERGAGVALELHFNAAAPGARGHEWLHWHASPKGNLLARRLSATVALRVPEIRPRGPVAIRTGDRGAGFLRATRCPAVIAETHFGTSSADCAAFSTRRQQYADAIATTLHSFSRTL